MHAQKFHTRDFEKRNARYWGVYGCRRCGGMVVAGSNTQDGVVIEIYPASRSVDDNIPSRARGYLQQAINSIHSPSGAVMLCASSVDAMLKEKSYKTGSLYSRINQAVKDHLITKEMALWAHEVRLDANDERHADENNELPGVEDAKHSIEFSLALAEFLFVLPKRIERGRAEASPSMVP